jgi:ketosteroid isomerase-like protein
MSGDNLEVVRGIYQRWARGDMGPDPDLFDPELVFESFMPDSSERVVSRGPEEAQSFMREFLAQWTDYRLFGERFREIGADRILVEGHQSGRGRLSGAAVKSPMNSVWTFRDGRVVHLVFEPDLQRALEAAGAAD